MSAEKGDIWAEFAQLSFLPGPARYFSNSQLRYGCVYCVLDVNWRILNVQISVSRIQSCRLVRKSVLYIRTIRLYLD
jgi:hypothetical protein